MEEGRWTGQLTSDYAQRKLAELRQSATPDQPTAPKARLRGAALREAILGRIDEGGATHSALAEAGGYEDEDNPLCELIAHMIERGEITFDRTGREVYSRGARGTVDERLYRRKK